MPENSDADFELETQGARRGETPPRGSSPCHRTQALDSWMREYQDGSTRAFERIFHAVRDEVYGFLRATVPDRSMVDDVFQESFLQMHRSRGTYQPGRSVRAWIFGVVRHVRASTLRSEARRIAREQTPIVLDHYTEDALEKLLTRELASRALGSLPLPQREVVLLHYGFGWSFAEIARTQGTLEVTAKLRGHRGLKRLRRGVTGLVDPGASARPGEEATP